MSGVGLSIVIPCFNVEQYIAQTLEALLALSLPASEILVIDDGSSDNTAAAVKPFLNEQLRYFLLPASGGPATPRNYGIRKARGKWVALFDADDIPLPGALAGVEALFEAHPNVGMVCADFHSGNDQGVIEVHGVASNKPHLQKVRENRIAPNDWYIGAETAFLTLIKSNFVGTSSVVIPKEVFQRVGYFNAELANLDDREMWLRIVKQYDLIYRDTPAYIYRHHAGSISTLHIDRQHLERAKVGENFLDQSLSPQIEKELKLWVSRNYLSLGYLRFHHLNDRPAAREAFLKSYQFNHSWASLKGILKSSLPASIYHFLNMVKEMRPRRI